MRLRTGLLLTMCLLSPAVPVAADEFTYFDERREEVAVQARLLGSGLGFQALERADGQLRVVPAGAIRRRENTGDPAPVTCDGMADLLREQFGAELTRIEIQKPFVVAMILSAPLDKPAEPRAQAFIKKAARFMVNVNGVFEKYAQSMHFPLRDPRYPLVLAIFESDDAFNRYAEDATGGRGLSATSITGFYSALTNWLAVRMSACDSFEVPLHEAIHQQMYNRVFQRLAAIPKWFDEGIATGFEGNGERIDSNPAKVNTRYARLAMRLAPDVRWASVVARDDAFTADVLVGDAYTLAWCIHWMLATQHKDKYTKYVEDLAKRPPLEEVGAEERVEHFESTFGVSIADIHTQFPVAVQTAARRQKVNLADAPQTTIANEQQALGQFSIKATQLLDRGGQLQVAGMLKNISPLRALTFYVTVETEGGVYADWVAADVKPNQQINLPSQMAHKHIPGVRRGPSDSYRVFVRSAPADSREASEWKSGQVPGPISGER